MSRLQITLGALLVFIVFEVAFVVTAYLRL
jgi:hypothetical protein